KINESSLSFPRNLKLADPNYHIPGNIDLLLGASVFWELLGSKQIRSSRKAPIVQETSLGWIISGNVHQSGTHQQQHKAYCGISTNAEIQRQLEKFWHMEEIKQPKHYSQEEIQEHFLATHSRNAEGRFRLKALERKLEKQPALKQQYHEFMHEYLELNHMSEVPVDKIDDKPVYYIPHHAVLKEDGITTKLRVVFDASCKTTSGQSLNDFLQTGPNLQDDLSDIIIRLRQHEYALAADIKMYRQVEVADEHPEYGYYYNTVTYGMTNSSFEAIRSMQETAHQAKKHYPRACEVIIKDFYVDDLLTGANSIEELKKLKHDIVNVLSSAKFELSKWKSNTAKISESDNNEVAVRIGETTKILGLWWNTNTDTFHYRVKGGNDKERITKRNILSRIAAIYDLLGWMGLLVVRAKIILQLLWQMNKDWDENITGETCAIEANKWHTFVANRVAEINRITNGAPWYHVKSKDNPADPLSRGVSAEKMESMKLWWEGPDFLHHNSPLYAFKPTNTISDMPEAR
ncbi:uncharacterized protein LOC112452640, partial [Temnothorax curvispinosus]|uniref:Uncharacterized protein LOC112452640 n=1 Tax=Temnothorax curvispinosus TaxID=300111 RepID=A0A6J1PGN8_9HYME